MEATEPGPPVCLRGPGRPWPPGLTAELVDGEAGVNVAVHARDATAVDLCLFSEDGLTETARLRLPGHTDGVWHGFVAGVPLGQRYGLRAEGPWRPLSGQHFNPARLLIDPWTCSLPGDVSHLAREVGYRWGSPLQADTTDNASRVPKSRLIDRDAERRAGAAVARAPHVAPGRMVLYEAHVKSLTALHPDVPEDLRGTYAGLASAAVTGHLRRLGVTTLCLLPVFRAIDERHLLDKGLHNHWGYNTLSYFVPNPVLPRAAPAKRGRAMTVFAPSSGRWSTGCIARASKWCWTWCSTTPPRAMRWGRPCAGAACRMPPGTGWIRKGATSTPAAVAIPSTWAIRPWCN